MATYLPKLPDSPKITTHQNPKSKHNCQIHHIDMLYQNDQNRQNLQIHQNQNIKENTIFTKISRFTITSDSPESQEFTGSWWFNDHLHQVCNIYQLKNHRLQQNYKIHQNHNIPKYSKVHQDHQKIRNPRFTRIFKSLESQKSQNSLKSPY